MKTKEQIQLKIEEVELYENECELMASCIATNDHPSNYKWKTFNDVDLAFKLSADTWMGKSIQYMKIADALKWVLKQ